MSDEINSLLDEFLCGYPMERFTARSVETLVYRCRVGTSLPHYYEAGIDDALIDSEIAKAMNGNGIAFDALLETAADVLTDCGQLQPKLARFTAAYLTGRITKPPRFRPDKDGNALRDGAIYAAVDHLQSHHSMTLTLAYEIVADYLRKKGRDPSTAKAVKTIHLKQRRVFGGMKKVSRVGPLRVDRI